MDKQDLALLLRSSRIFASLSANALEQVLELMTVINLNQKEVLFREGDTADSLYIVVTGQLDACKSTAEQEGVGHVIASFAKGEVIGELALIDQQPRSGTIRAKTNATLIKLDYAVLENHEQLATEVKQEIMTVVCHRLRHTSQNYSQEIEQELKEVKARDLLGQFLMRALLITSVYTLLLSSMQVYLKTAESTTPLSVIIIACIGMLLVKNIRHSNMPLSFFGIFKKGSLVPSIIAVTITAAVCLLATLLKYAYIGESQTLFNYQHFATHDGHFSWQNYISSVFLYSCFAPLQELITRSILQTSLYEFVVGSERYRKWNSIILSNLIFSAIHAHMSLIYSVVVFVPGVFWGVLYHKQRSWTAVSLSHILIGVYFLFILGPL